jgi:hypothetical protein
MRYVLGPLIAVLVVSPISAWCIVKWSRTSAVEAMEKFAYEADLGLTDDVRPALTELMTRRIKRASTLMAVAVPLIAALFVAASELHRLNLFTFAFYPLLVAGLPFTKPRPRWPDEMGSSVAHGQRVRVRDYADPWILSAVTLVWVLDAAFAAAAFVMTTHRDGREQSASAVALLALFGAEFTTLAVRRLRSRARARTLQQLAFTDALTSEALGQFLFLMPILGIASIELMSPEVLPLRLLSLSSACFVVAACVIVLNVIRKQQAPQRFKRRLYPEATSAPPDPRFVARLRAMWAS